MADEKSESCLISEVNTDAINQIAIERDTHLLEKKALEEEICKYKQ